MRKVGKSGNVRTWSNGESNGQNGRVMVKWGQELSNGQSNGQLRREMDKWSHGERKHDMERNGQIVNWGEKRSNGPIPPDQDTIAISK